MADKPWKAFEREVATLFGGHRHPANQGGRVDVTGPVAVVQCKHVRVLSLEALTKLATEMQTIGEEYYDKLSAGVVAVKVRRGAGRASPTLVVMTADVFRKHYRRSEEGATTYAKDVAIGFVVGAVP